MSSTLHRDAWVDPRLVAPSSADQGYGYLPSLAQLQGFNGSFCAQQLPVPLDFCGWFWWGSDVADDVPGSGNEAPIDSKDSNYCVLLRHFSRTFNESNRISSRTPGTILGLLQTARRAQVIMLIPEDVKLVCQ